MKKAIDRAFYISLMLAVAFLMFAVVHGPILPVGAQTIPTASSPSAKIFTAYALTPISATAAVGSAAVLTIPAPATGYYNYVCYLALEGSNNGTVLAGANLVTASTNFNSFAAKFSITGATGALDSDTGVLPFINSVAPGCAKSAASATATTFTSPTNTDEAFNWMAVYFQAP